MTGMNRRIDSSIAEHPLSTEQYIFQGQRGNDDFSITHTLKDICSGKEICPHARLPARESKEILMESTMIQRIVETIRSKAAGT
jgi:hypothetical protein